MPSITKNAGRQYPLVARVDFTYTDLMTSGANVAADVAIPAIDIPQNAVVTGGELVITTAFAGPVTLVADVGDGVDDNRYINNGNMATAARVAITPTGHVYTAADTIDLNVTAGATTASSAGAGYLQVEYILTDRTQENYR